MSSTIREHKFLALMDHGKYLDLPDLSAVETRLFLSPGYQRCLNEQVRLSLSQQQLLLSLGCNTLWSLRHQSPQAQEEFDKHDGLVLKL